MTRLFATIALVATLAACSAGPQQSANGTATAATSDSGTPAQSATVLTQEQAESSLLGVDDLNDTYSASIDDNDGPDLETGDLGCLSVLDVVEGEVAVTAERAFTDDFLTEAASFVSSYRTTSAATEYFDRARRALENCSEVELELDDAGGQKLRLEVLVAAGPVAAAQDQIRVDLISGVEAPVAVSASLWSGRVANNVASTGLFYIGAGTDLDSESLALRAFEKLAAVTAGQPIPPSEEQEAAAARQLSFGETYVSDATGNRMTLGVPQPYTRSDTASAEQGRDVVVDVKAESDSSEPLEAYNFSFSATCGGVAAPMIYDSAQGLDGGSPPGDILPGRSSTWRIGFTIAQPEPCELIVTMDYGLGDSVYWVGQA